MALLSATSKFGLPSEILTPGLAWISVYIYFFKIYLKLCHFDKIRGIFLVPHPLLPFFVKILKNKIFVYIIKWTYLENGVLSQ